MNIHDVGSGQPVVLIPGIQGRWEWMRPAVDVLSRRFRVVTFSLCDEPSSGARFDETRGFDCYFDQILAAMDTCGLDRATLSGVSYGGLIAASFAARCPNRVSSLVLISALPPAWRTNRRAGFYLKAPLLLSPLFALSSLRLFREMHRAYGGVASGVRHALKHVWNVLTHPGSPVRMARRIRLLSGVDPTAELTRLKTETLVITGEDELDDVVAPGETRRYLTLWPHASSVVLQRTGHLGIITRPEEISRLLEEFLRHATPAQETRRRIG
jgi:pimeloyl-ACP methyl ester carboxylesterase